MKKNAWIRLYIWSFISILLIFVFFKFLPERNTFLVDSFFLDSSAKTLLHRPQITTIPHEKLEEIKKIRVLWGVGSVLIQFENRDDIRLEVHSQGKPSEMIKAKHRIDDNIISISDYIEGKENVFSVFKNTSLVMHVPTAFELDVLYVASNIGTISIAGEPTHIGYIDLFNEFGAIELQGNTTADRLSIYITSAPLKVTGTFDKIDVSTASSNETFMLYNTPSSMKLFTITGSASIFLPKDAGFKAELSSRFGRLSSSFAPAKNNKLTYGDGAANFYFESVSGNMTLNQMEINSPSVSPLASFSPTPSPSPAPTSVLQQAPASGRSF